VRIIQSRAVVRIGFAALIVIWISTFVVEQVTFYELNKAQTRVRQLEQARSTVNALVSVFLNAETGQRGFLLTGDEKYLAPYDSARTQLDSLTSRLDPTLDKAPDLHQLLTLGSQKLSELAEVIDLQRSGKSAEGLAVVRSGQGQAVMNQIRSVAAKFDQDIANQSQHVSDEVDRKRQRAIWLSILLESVMGAGLISVFFLIGQLFESREQALCAEQQANLETQEALAAERVAHSEAAHANRLKDEFLGVVSHELRTPLTAILGWTTLLRQGPDDENELGEGLEAIERNANVQKRLVEDLLDVSRIVSGKLRLQIKEVNLRETTSNVLDGLLPSAEAKDIHVDYNWSGEAVEVLGDSDRLQQIAWNLLSNAIKFTPRGGKVLVQLSRVESTVELMVQDNGQGIKPEFLPRIFERFTQEDAGTARNKMGLGLGLAITRHLVELHGGKISAESPGENQGATFRVQIPVVAVREFKQQLSRRPGMGTSSQEPVTFPAGDLRQIRVLAIDDQLDTLTVIRRVLMRAGAEVQTAESVADAWSFLETWRPDILLSDIGMPGEDGYSLIRRIRRKATEDGGQIPAIALTAFAKQEDYQRAIQAGFDDHLAKPVDANLLTSKLADLVRRRRHMQGSPLVGR
jgi:signal transduction histidine kinase/ActR/RegA family two-component response regulator